MNNAKGVKLTDKFKIAPIEICIIIKINIVCILNNIRCN